jgi:hypothetical protein
VLYGPWLQKDISKTLDFGQGPKVRCANTKGENMSVTTRKDWTLPIDVVTVDVSAYYC